MEKILAVFMPPEMASFVFMFSVVLCLLFSFLIICFARVLGNKLLLLGVLIGLTAFVFTATMPAVIPLAFGMVAIAFVLVLTGVVVSLITHFSGSSKSDSASQE